MPAAEAPPRVAHDLLLACVTAVLKRRLENGLVDRGVTGNLGADATVSALPPDRIDTGTEEKPQLNLFVYQVKLKGLDYGSRIPDANSAGWYAGSPFFELNYLVTAYGSEDLQMEVLLGYALEMFHATPVIDGNDARAALESLSSAEGGRVVLPGLAKVAKSGLAERIDNIRLSSLFLTTDEMFNLWSTLQATYRPSAAYRVSVYLRETGSDG